MIRGLYTACSGMMVQMIRQDVLANNLANVSSAGFKKDVVTSQDFRSLLLDRMGETERQGPSSRPSKPITVGSLGTGSTIANISTDFSAGSIRATQNPYDFALGQDNYFTIETPQGIAYTRNGAFGLNAEGRLVNGDGNPVMGQEGYIETEEGLLTIDEQGNIIENGDVIETLNIVSIADPQVLSKAGDNLFLADEQEVEVEENPRVMQGFLEASNVNAVKEMVDLITVTRAYEVLQKVIQSQDQSLDKLVNEAGSL